jgi:proline iminopeptidase
MPRYTSYDGTELAYRVLGDGPPLVCLPGGPGRSVDYLGDLGGLGQLIQLDLRGVGLSPDPTDPTSFRVDRLVDDVEALRAHLDLDRMDLLAHSAGAVLATLYAAAHPDRVARLILITPGLAALDVRGTEEQFDATLQRLTTQPWYPTARAALDEIRTGDLSLAAFRASRPLFYAHWNDEAQANATIGITERHLAARQGYFAGVTLDPSAIRTALTKLTAPVLLYAGDLDPLVTPAMLHQAAPLFPDATVVVQPNASHFPWIDDPTAFAGAINSFLALS